MKVIKPFLIPLFMALFGVVVGLWSIWPEPDVPAELEGTLQAPVETEGEL